MEFWRRLYKHRCRSCSHLQLYRRLPRKSQVTSGGNEVSYEETLHISSTSISETSLAGSFVYPNPTKDVINIEKETSFTNAIYKLYAINGTVISSGDLSGKRKQLIDLSNETAGIYYLNIISNDGNMTRKIVKN